MSESSRPREFPLEEIPRETLLGWEWLSTEVWASNPIQFGLRSLATVNAMRLSAPLSPDMLEFAAGTFHDAG